MESKSLNLKKGIWLVIISTLIIACAQFFLKKGANLANNTFMSYLNVWIIIGVIIYGLATILFVISLKFTNLSTAYPILGLGYVWVSLISYFVFKEALSALDLIGIITIIAGVIVLGVFESG